MRGTKAKRLRRLGLKSGPAPRGARLNVFISGPWARTGTPLTPNPEREARAHAKRERRRKRNQANGGDA